MAMRDGEHEAQHTASSTYTAAEIYKGIKDNDKLCKEGS